MTIFIFEARFYCSSFSRLNFSEQLLKMQYHWLIFFTFIYIFPSLTSNPWSVVKTFNYVKQFNKRFMRCNRMSLSHYQQHQYGDERIPRVFLDMRPQHQDAPNLEQDTVISNEGHPK